MDFEDKCHQITDIDGHIEAGKQFDLNIVLPEDNRGALFGIIKDCYKEPVKDAVVKLIEVDCEHGKEERKPVSHTFTDEDGEFVFGPLCPDKKYEVQIWVDRVKHVKICAKCHREGRCLKGVDLKNCDCFVGKKEDFEKCKEHCCDKKDEWDKCKEHDKKDDCDKCKEHDKKDDCDKCKEHDKKDDCNKCKEHDKKDDCNKCKEPCCPKKDNCDKCEEHDKKDDCDKCKEHCCPRRDNWGKFFY